MIEGGGTGDWLTRRVLIDVCVCVHVGVCVCAHVGGAVLHV